MGTASTLGCLVCGATCFAAIACGGSSGEKLFGQAGQGGASGAAAGAAGTSGSPATGGSSAQGGSSAGGTAGHGATSGAGGTSGTAGTGGTSGGGGAAGGGATGGFAGTGGTTVDPHDCATAASYRSNVGCEFWPTVTANLVWSIFDFAVIAVNPGTQPAGVNITGPSAFNVSLSIAPGSSEVIALPWVASLKGPETDTCGNATAMTATVLQSQGAYHLTSNRAIAVSQFNPLESDGVGGPAGKNWSSCPGSQICSTTFTAEGCFSFSNDASMLLPTTSLTATYRVAGPSGWASAGTPVMPSHLVITATQDNTQVGLTLKGRTLAGGGLAAMSAGTSTSVLMQKGDVLELIGGSLETDDFSGSLVSASAPVQVISGMACRDVPTGTSACDHLEETVPPAETLGATYLVTVPAGPNGAKAPSQQVKLVGNVDGTMIQFDPAISAAGVVNGQATLAAGQVLELGMQASDFKVSGNHEFAVVTFMGGAGIVDPNSQPPNQKGDPSQSYVVPLEQFRDSYLLATPVDFSLTFLNIVAHPSVVVTLDGSVVASSSFAAIGSSGIGVSRLALPKGGSHTLTASAPVGVQLYGYGAYTSYQLPGGADARLIAPVPTK